MLRHQRTVALTAALAATAVTGAAHAQTSFNQVSGSWTNGANWSAGSPNSGVDALVNNGGTALIGAGDAAAASRVFLGSTAGTSGTIHMTGGSLTLPSASSNRLYVGNAGSGTFTLDAGTVSTNRFYVGNTGGGVFTQNGGSVTGVGALHIGGDAGSGTGTYHLNGGTATFNYGYVGQAGTGTLNNNGGAFSNSGHFYIGNSAGSNGTYNFKSGTHVMTGESTNVVSFNIGAAGNGVLNLGDANTTGSITETSNFSVDFNVRTAVNATGTVRGWGTIALDGQLQNNGRIIADGYGQSRTLDFTSMAGVTVTDGRRNDETGSNGTNGWFAVNGGRLALPTLTVGASEGVSWGENSAHADNDAVNSLRITTDADVIGGDLGIALLAQDHSSVDLTGLAAVIGIWSVDDGAFDIGTGALSLVVRYDDALASALAVDENDLQLLAFDGTSWQAVGGTLDASENTLSVTGVDALPTQFAVGVIPEPASLSLLLLGAGFMFRGRSIHR